MQARLEVWGRRPQTSDAPGTFALGPSTEGTGDHHAVLRLPRSSGPAREAGALSGQAPMAAGTTTVIAVSAARDGFVPMTTVQQSTSFTMPGLRRIALETGRSASADCARAGRSRGARRSLTRIDSSWMWEPTENPLPTADRHLGGDPPGATDAGRHRGASRALRTDLEIRVDRALEAGAPATPGPRAAPGSSACTLPSCMDCRTDCSSSSALW